MKRTPLTSGFAAMPMVASMALLLLLGTTMVFRSSLLRRDQAAQAQLRLDYHEREEALLRALVAVFPQKAIASLKSGYAPSDAHSWAAVFQDSVRAASSQTALPETVVAALNLGRIRRADVGEHTSAELEGWLTSLSGIPGQVTPGTTAYEAVFQSPEFAGKVPPLLAAPVGLADADAVRPVVGLDKVYPSQAPGLLADVARFPRYNLIAYPNIRFGYAKPGDPFVAKRNWWAFTVNFGGSLGRAKHYILSLYEVPSQLPIEGAAFTEIGRHLDGTAWAAGITIDGGVYGDSLLMNASHGASRLAGRRDIEMESEIELAGTSVGGDFDDPGVREQLMASTGSRSLPVALSANSGRVVFFPIPTGPAFLDRAASGPGPWDSYVGGGNSCQVTVEAVSMVSYEDQTPVVLRIRFQGANGSAQEVVLRRGENWPTILEAGGDILPFQTELTNSERSCVTFYPSVFNAWVQSQGGASVEVNRSFHFSTVASADPLTVRPFSSPPAAEDMCVILRKGKDLTEYTSGLSIVAPLRVYLGDDLNAVAAPAAPEGSGLPEGAVFYPPMSIFAAELRVGTTPFNRPFSHFGQIGTLAAAGPEVWRPLDVRSGTDEAVHSDGIEAELSPLRSPAELPPVHQMNWLVVIEEIPQD